MTGLGSAHSYDGGMTPPVPPAPVCAPAQVGPCAGCGHPTQKYGHQACPLCVLCHAPVLARQAKKLAV